jgi:ABC-type spermidine/putrescine transport system permease subunit I
MITAKRSRVHRVTLVLLAPASLFLVAFFIGPLLVNFLESFETADGRSLWHQYSRALTDLYYLEVLRDTVLLSLAVTTTSLIIGYPYALAINRAGPRLRSALIFLVVAPLLVNVVVRSFGWMVVFGRSGLVNAVLDFLGLPGVNMSNSWLAIGLALVHVLLPFMVLSIASTLEGIDEALEEAAITLGAPPWRRFVHITLPLSLEGVITGSLLVSALTLGSFVTVMLMGTNRTMVLPWLMYQQLTVASDWPFAAALGMILLVVVLFILWFQARLRSWIR